MFSEQFDNNMYWLLIFQCDYPITFLLLQPYDVEDHMQDWDAAFDWSIYFGQPGFEVYKMVVTGNDVIQGVIAIERKSDHVYIHLIESAPHNRYDKQFKYVGLHLVHLLVSEVLTLDMMVLLRFDQKLILG